VFLYVESSWIDPTPESGIRCFQGRELLVGTGKHNLHKTAKSVTGNLQEELTDKNDLRAEVLNVDEIQNEDKIGGTYENLPQDGTKAG
jgi:hypothetical protein